MNFIIDSIRNCRVYGPYTRKDGRQHVVLVAPDKNGGYTKDTKKTTVSYPKWLQEQKLGRILDPDLETIDHINKDFLDNSDKNIRIISRSQHSSDDALRIKEVELTCIWCNSKFKNRITRNHARSKKLGKAGPFCSRNCSGKYGAELQNKRIRTLENKSPEVQYYYKEK